MRRKSLRKETVNPYSALASIYDFVMAHVDYQMWANYIKAFFRLAHRPVLQVADLSCGTGNLLTHLKSFNRQVLGFDISLPMLQIAKQKFPEIKYCCSDFTALSIKTQTLDIALSLYDSVNYIISDQEVLNFFSEAFRVLKPGGLFIFDIVTPYLCESAFKKYHENAQIDENTRYERFSFFKVKEQMQINQFRIWHNGKYFFEEHQQKIRPVKDWVQLISQSDFKIVEIFSNFSMKPVMETSERAHFVLRRPV